MIGKNPPRFGQIPPHRPEIIIKNKKKFIKGFLNVLIIFGCVCVEGVLGVDETVDFSVKKVGVP